MNMLHGVMCACELEPLLNTNLFKHGWNVVHRKGLQ